MENQNKLFSNKYFWTCFTSFVPCVIQLLKSLNSLPNRSLQTEAKLDILILITIFVKAIEWCIKSEKYVCSESIKLLLYALDEMMKYEDFFCYIACDKEVLTMSAIIISVYQLMKYLLLDFDFPSISLSIPSTLAEEHMIARETCIIVSALIEWLEKTMWSECNISVDLFKLLKSVITGLARLPFVNSFARSPPSLWQLDWKPEYSGKFNTYIPPPPGGYLQDRDVLKQYIYRINLIGWISRQQFEETWMSLLGVLSATPIDGGVDGLEEDQERIRTSCLAVKSVTSLLLQTLLLPQPGNPHKSHFLIQPRDKSLFFQHTKCGKKLMNVRLPIHLALQKLQLLERIDENVLDINCERIADPYCYSLSQVSLEYLSATSGRVEELDDPDGSVSSSSSPLSANAAVLASFQQREQCLADVGLDIHSCLHFLLDLYSQWLSPQTCPHTPLTLLTDVTKSVVALSDIFMEKSQFEWMLDTFLEVQRIHPAEDEIITQYLIFGICKSVAVLGIEKDALDKLKKLLELSLKSSYQPTKVSSLHGLLYLLEQGNGDESVSLLPTATEYVLKHLETTNNYLLCNDNEDYICVLWAVAFYIVENYQDEISEDELSQIYKICYNVCSDSEMNISSPVYLTVLHGLERLLVAEIITGKEANALLKVSIDKMHTGNSITSLASLGFFLSCMYIGKSTNMWSDTFLPDSSKTCDKVNANGKHVDAEFLLVAMERVTTLFYRIRKTYPFEAEIICDILPEFLMEFFPEKFPEILNKVITSFLSSQHCHPQLMMKVIYEVFQYLHKQSQQDVIHEWILLSLSNFMQISPFSMAVWSLTCFFICGITNPWLQALFPFVQNRIGKMEEIDKSLFCMCGVSFRNQLQDESQRNLFCNTFQSAVHTQELYADFHRCLNAEHRSVIQKRELGNL